MSELPPPRAVCSACGQRMLHDRSRGVLELDGVVVVLVCENCDYTERVPVKPDCEWWEPAIRRMMYGRSQPDPGTDAVPRQVPVRTILEEPDEVALPDQETASSADRSGEVDEDQLDRKLDDILEDGGGAS